MAPVRHLKELITARKHYAYGKQHSYMDDANIIGWTREGDAEHPKSMAVIMTDAAGGGKWMYAGKPSTEFKDHLSNRTESVWTNSDGWAYFPVNGGSVSVWVSQ